MISLKESILSETEFSMYSTICYVEFNEEANITEISQLIRALPRVTVVNNKSKREDEKANRGYLLIKIITTKPSTEAFAEMKQAALRDIPAMKKLNYLPDQIKKADKFY